MNLRHALHIVLDELILDILSGKEWTAEQTDAMLYLRNVQYAPFDLVSIDEMIETFNMQATREK